MQYKCIHQTAKASAFIIYVSKLTIYKSPVHNIELFLDIKYYRGLKILFDYTGITSIRHFRNIIALKK